MTNDLNPTKVQQLLTDAWSALTPADQAERIAYDEARGIPGATMHPDEHGLIEFRRGGRPLAVIHHDLLTGPGDLAVERQFVSDDPDAELRQLTDPSDD